MKAMLSRQAGGPETLTLQDLPDPVPGPGEVLIEVKACAVNYPDVLIIEDRYQFKPPRPFAPGGEVAGIVESVGAGVAAFKPGDRVIGSCIAGGMAEKLALQAGVCTAVPAIMPFDEASALVLTYGTSIHALKDRAKLQKGETLLVLGAAGGVGLSAVELGKAFGARVIAAASSDEKVAFAKKHGADGGVVYPAGPFDKAGARVLADLFKSACGEKGADVIYDPVGGDIFDLSLKVIAFSGRLLVIGFASGKIPTVQVNRVLLKNISVVGLHWGAYRTHDPAKIAPAMEELFALYEKGLVTPVVSSVRPLAEAAAALDEIASRRSVGKVLLTP